MRRDSLGPEQARSGTPHNAFKPRPGKRAVQFAVERMRVEHIPAVSAIERESFSQPWPSNAYRKELQGNRMAHYFVARRLDAPAFSLEELGLHARQAAAEPSLVGRVARLFKPLPRTAVRADNVEELTRIVGYAGLWLMVDEAHITTIAVHPKYRGHGLGELLLLQLIDTATEIDAHWLTLEVRRSNSLAQALYRKYTFKEMGVRRRYYSDDGEDALIMWSDRTDAPEFTRSLERNRGLLKARFANDG
jgi:ribosomal-protein-alanine N-acetyltransferase